MDLGQWPVKWLVVVLGNARYQRADSGGGDLIPNLLIREAEKFLQY